MFGIDNYASFITALLLFQLIPGAGTITILNASTRGVRAGMAAVGGTLAGDSVYMIAAATGIASVMAAKPLLFDLLKWAGTAYLIWSGILLLCSKNSTQQGSLPAPPDCGRHFRQGAAVSLSNPKVALFFISFFPLFINRNTTASILAAMVLHVFLISLTWQSILVIAGNATAKRLGKHRWIRTAAERLAGTALIFLGIRLSQATR